MHLTSDQSLTLVFEVMDDDEMTYNVDENVSLSWSGVTVESVSREKRGGTYTFALDIDISDSGRLNGRFWAEDCHSLTSSVAELNYELIRIDGFEYQEKAPGESEFHSLADYHVCWTENENRLHFLTTPQIDYNDSARKSAFEALLAPIQVQARAWNWTGNDYVQSSEWGELTGNGVFNLKIVARNLSNNEVLTFERPQYYCFNSISNVSWTTPQNYSEMNEDLEIVEDSSSAKLKAYVEQKPNTTTGARSVEKNVATVNVRLSCIIPPELQATVSVHWFDPNNPVGSTVIPTTNGIGARDNHGSITSTIPVTLTFNQQNGTLVQSHAYTISDGYVGDNFIVAAYPNPGVLERAKFGLRNDVPNELDVATSNGGGESGGSFFELKRTPILTVWRTLWVERDNMTITGSAGNVIGSTEVVPIDGFISSEFARACIEIKEYLPNIETTVAGSMFLTRNNLRSARNSPSSSDSFWTLWVTSDFSFEDNQYCSSEEGKILGVCSSFFSYTV